MDHMVPSTSGGYSAHLSFEDRRASSAKNTKNTKDTTEGRVEELLSSMSVYSAPTFQPLTRALEILSSPRAEEELARLRSDWQEVDALVDHVVALHHVEFSTALQEYSRVVTLMREVHLCMNEVRRCLGVAMDGVRVEEEGLARVTTEYADMVEMRKMLAMIGEVVDALAEVEGGIDAAVEEGAEVGVERGGVEAPPVPSWHHVKLLLKAGNVLARGEMRDIPAMKGLVDRAQAMAEKVVGLLVREVRRQAFHVGPDGGAGDVTDALRVGHVLPFGSSSMIDRELVSCIARLGAVDDAVRAVQDGARQVLRAELVRAVHALDMADGQRGNETPLGVVGEMLRHADAFFTSACMYVRLLLEEPVSAPSSGLTLIRGRMGTGGTVVGSSPSVVRECRVLWEGVQRELLHVLAAALGVSVQSKSSMIDFDPEDERITFLDSIRRTNSVDHQEGLVFSIDDQVRGQESADLDGDEGAPAWLRGSTQDYSVIDLERAVKGAIGEDSCSVRTSPSLYLPVRAFVLGCCGRLDELQAAERQRLQERASPSSPPSPSSMSILDRIQANFSKVTLRGGHAQETGDRGDGQDEFLLAYLVDILRTDFIPSVYTECSHRNEVVATWRAGSSHKHAAASYLVAQHTIDLIKDVFEWCEKAPVIMCDLIGIVENSLGKIAESLRSQACSVGARAGAMDPSGGEAHPLQAVRMARDPKISHMMAQEPIATLVGGPEWFVCRDTTATMDSFLTSAIASSFALGRQVLPDELVKCFVSLMPVEQSSLILLSNSAGAIKSVASIAAVGQTAELIANGIYESVGVFSERMHGRSKENRGSRTTVTGQSPKFVGLIDVANRFRAVAGLCARTLRIEAMLTVAFAMTSLLDTPDINPDDRPETPATTPGGRRDVPRAIERDVALVAPKLATMDEVLSNHLPLSLRQYIFGSLQTFVGKAAAQMGEGADDDRAQAVGVLFEGIDPVTRVGGNGKFTPGE